MARPNTTDGNRYLDSNNRLSSAGAAQSLRYARPQDLPSYPTSGLPPNHQKRQDATTAATLGWQNQKSVEPWKPESSGAAATAATRGWGTTAPKQWQPQQSMSGARAAVLAAQRNKNLPAQGVTAPPAPAPKPGPSAWGNAAANLAVSNSRSKRPGTSTPPNTTFRPSGGIDRQGSLMAATGAMAPRRRADSSPVVRSSYPDQANARANALRAATQAQSNSMKPKAVPVGGANPAVIMPRGKLGYNPGSQPVQDDKAHQEAMKSSAVAMAQAMYKMMEKNKNDKEATAGAVGALSGRNRSLSLSSGSDAVVAPMRFNGLHAEAERLAAMRLASMHDEEAQSREWREYYAGQLGPAPGQPQPSASKRFSLGAMFGRTRRNSEDSMDDNVETRKIREQMKVFQSDLSKVDDKKRAADRQHILEVAQRNVRKDLYDIDQKVYQKTGKATPALQSTWDQEAMQRQQAEIYAQQQHEERMQNFGRINIGSGTYMDQEQVDETARRNVQPVLDDIEVHNQERLESEETQRLDAEERKRLAGVEKQRAKESKELDKNIKQQMKEEAKTKKEEEKLSRKQTQKGSRLSRFGSISRSKRQPAVASDAESSHLVSDAAPVLAPVPATQPISFAGQNASSVDGDDNTHQMSGAVRTTTTDTERATRESMVSARGESVDGPAAVPIPKHPSDENLAREANQDMQNSIPVSNTEYRPGPNKADNPIANPTALPATVVTPIVPFASDVAPKEQNETIDAVGPVTINPQKLDKPVTVDATPKPVVPAENTSAYNNVRAATPPAQALTKKQIDQKPEDAAASNTAANTGTGASNTEAQSPKQKRGVRGWLKKAFHRSSSGEDNTSKSSKRNSKIQKDDPKGKRPMISDPVQQQEEAAQPDETTHSRGGGSTQARATQDGAGPSGSNAAATSGPLDSHPDVHAVDSSLYDATPPGTGTGVPGDQRESMIAYERDQDRARANDELAVSDLEEDDDLAAGRVARPSREKDASTVSMLSAASMERKRKQEIDAETEADAGTSRLPKVHSEAEMERRAERDEAEDGLGGLDGPRFQSEARAGSPARETKFREDV